MKSRTNAKMTLTFMYLLLIVSVLIAGCSSGETTESSDQTEGGTPTITMMNIFHSNTPPSDEDPVMVAIEELSDVNLEMTWVPQNVYSERLNVTLSSGEMPQLIRVTNVFWPPIQNGIKSGMFWELTPYLEEFENLSNYNPVVLDNIRVEGKIYGIPLLRPVVRDGVIIREDWLNNLNRELPTTIDEFYDLLVAFTHEDPDGNGVDDTYGMLVYEGLSQPFKSIRSWLGAPNNWKMEDGKFIKDVETAEYMEALNFFKKLYNEGLINSDFPIVERNEARNDLYNDKVGVTIEALDALFPFYYLKMGELGLQFDLTAAPPINNRTFAGLGNSGTFMIPKSSVETEEDLRTILSYLDRQRSPDVAAQFTELVTENAKKPAEEQFNVDNLNNMVVNDAALYPPAIDERNEMVRERMEDLASLAVSDPSVGLISPTYNERGTQLDTILEDAEVQYVLGEIDEAGFYAAVEDWKEQGGRLIAEELADLYVE